MKRFVSMLAIWPDPLTMTAGYNEPAAEEREDEYVPVTFSTTPITEQTSLPI